MSNQQKTYLRAMEPEDLDELYNIENDTKLWNLGATNVPYSKYALRNFIANSTCDIYTDRQVRLIVCNEADETIGIVDVQNFDPNNLRAEIGIVIKETYRHQQYGESALRQIVDYAHQTLHLQHLYAIIAEDNTASLKLFEKAGFHHTTLLRNWLHDGKSYKNAQLKQLFL